MFAHPTHRMRVQVSVAADSVGMQWQDTFAFDNAGNLFFTTNRLQLFINVRARPCGACGWVAGRPVAAATCHRGP